jgi:hypothetical protein
MKLKRLIFIGGMINLLGALFHVFLIFKINELTGITPQLKILMHMYNVGGILMVSLFVYTSLFCVKDMAEQRLGKVITLFIFLVYFSRSAEEILFKGGNFSPVFFFSCLAVSFFYLYILYLMIRKKHGNE